MPEHPLLTSAECQKKAAECRLLAEQSPSLGLTLMLSRLAESWEGVAIKVELDPPLQGWRVPSPQPP